MFAGKSARLLEDNPPKASTLCLAPAFDSRSGASIHSRKGLARSARSVASWPQDAACFTRILLDEAHFMIAPYYKSDVVADIRTTLLSGIDVSVAGLDHNYLRQEFAVTSQLRRIADRYVTLTAICQVCGAPAIWTAKKHQTGKMLESGDTELYEPCCDLHWSAPG